jgi:hypothetical protein
MARSMVRALLLSAAVFSSTAAPTAPKQSVLRLPKRYHTATEFTAYSPSTTSATSALPLVLMLSGYCLPAQLQDDVRLSTIHPQVPPSSPLADHSAPPTCWCAQIQLRYKDLVNELQVRQE